MELVNINSIPEQAIAYNYKEDKINNLAEFRCAKVQLGRLLTSVSGRLYVTSQEIILLGMDRMVLSCLLM